MDLRYPALLVAGIIAIAAAAGAWVFYQRKITVRFEDGLRAANTSIVRRLPLYRRLRILSAAATVLPRARSAFMRSGLSGSICSRAE